MEMTVILLIGFIFSCIVGMVLGSTVNKTWEGLLCGGFLGPIGWIIVLLLPRPSETDTHASDAQSASSRASTAKIISDRPLRDLTSDAYRIWLGKTYDIKKNLLFEKYELNERLFETLDEAISQADSVEQEREIDLEKGETEAEREITEQRIAEEAGREKTKAQESNNDKFALVWIGMTLLISVAMLFFFMS